MGTDKMEERTIENRIQDLVALFNEGIKNIGNPLFSIEGLNKIIEELKNLHEKLYNIKFESTREIPIES